LASSHATAPPVANLGGEPTPPVLPPKR
jgi:hypothetical protein